MPKTGIRQTFELTTRDRFTKVECEIGLTVNGRELPNMEVLGKALEAGIQLIQDSITESYLKVPERVEAVAANAVVPAASPVTQVATPAVAQPATPAEKPIPSFGS
jgi:hypothetical protein